MGSGEERPRPPFNLAAGAGLAGPPGPCGLPAPSPPSQALPPRRGRDNPPARQPAAPRPPTTTTSVHSPEHPGVPTPDSRISFGSTRQLQLPRRTPPWLQASRILRSHTPASSAAPSRGPARPQPQLLAAPVPDAGLGSLGHRERVHAHTHARTHAQHTSSTHTQCTNKHTPNTHPKPTHTTHTPKTSTHHQSYTHIHSQQIHIPKQHLRCNTHITDTRMTNPAPNHTQQIHAKHCTHKTNTHTQPHTSARPTPTIDTHPSKYTAPVYRGKHTPSRPPTNAPAGVLPPGAW